MQIKSIGSIQARPLSTSSHWTAVAKLSCERGFPNHKLLNYTANLASCLWEWKTAWGRIFSGERCANKGPQQECFGN